VVKDKYANPVPGVSVLFSVASGNGTLTGATAATNASGVAAVTQWKLGPVVGANTVTASALVSSVAANLVTFTATGTPAAAAIVTAVGATTFAGTVGTAVTQVPSVKVTDSNGNAVSGAVVAFSASLGSTIVGGSKITNAQGIATPDSWILGNIAGSYTLSANVGLLAPVVFTASASPGAAALVTISAGNNQSAQVSRPVSIDPAVRVVDVFNNPVPGVTVTFEVTAGGGFATARSTTTNSSGIATVGGWTLGDAAGTNTLRATVTGTGITGNPVSFTATATVGAPSTMAANEGQSQTATAGTAVATAPSVLVKDARGNPVAGVAVTFAVGSGGGDITGASATTNAAGVATVGSWTLGAATGTQTLVAFSTGLGSVTFTATATAGAAARIVAWSTANQTGLTVGASLTASQRPAVRVTDAAGNPVVGQTVTFAVADVSSGSLIGASATTNANGIATVGGWTLPTVAGVTATVTAAVAGLEDSVPFTVTTVAGAASNMLVTRLPSGNAVTAPQVIAVTVQLRDVYNNLVSQSGVVITFTPGTGSGTTATPTATTNGSGVATMNWTVGSNATPSQTLVITSPGLTTVTVPVTVN
jgi:adhesin/invasin